MSNFVVVYDACVLYPAWLRDLLMQLAVTGLFRAKWTARIHQEWIESLLRNQPQLGRDALQRVAELMNKAVPNALVDDYEKLVDGLALPDADDRHVLAAAIHCGAQEVITFNLKDFPEQSLRPYGLKAQHPDEFVEHLLDLNSEAVCEAVRKIRSRLAKPAVTADEILTRYEQGGLAVSASILRDRANSL